MNHLSTVEVLVGTGLHREYELSFPFFYWRPMGMGMNTVQFRNANGSGHCYLMGRKQETEIYLENLAGMEMSRVGPAFSSLAFSTPAVWCRVFQSRVFHPCSLVPRFPFSRFPTLHFRPSRLFQSPVFSPPNCCTGMGDYGNKKHLCRPLLGSNRMLNDYTVYWRSMYRTAR